MPQINQSEAKVKFAITLQNQNVMKFWKGMVPGGGFEPPTRGFSIRCSTPELPGHILIACRNQHVGEVIGRSIRSVQRRDAKNAQF